MRMPSSFWKAIRKWIASPCLLQKISSASILPSWQCDLRSYCTVRRLVLRKNKFAFVKRTVGLLHLSDERWGRCSACLFLMNRSQ